MGLKRFVAAVAVLALVAGCAHRLEVGEERVIERSGGRPGWVKAPEPVIQKDGSWLFRGVVSHAASLEMGLRLAEADAKKRLVGQISELVEAEYTQYATSSGGGEPAQFVADGISWASQRVAVAGARPAKTYWERVATRLPSGVEHFWRVYCLLEVATEDLELAKREAAEALKERRRRETDRKAEEEARRLLEKLEPGQ